MVPSTQCQTETPAAMRPAGRRADVSGPADSMVAWGDPSGLRMRAIASARGKAASRSLDRLPGGLQEAELVVDRLERFGVDLSQVPVGAGDQRQLGQLIDFSRQAAR